MKRFLKNYILTLVPFVILDAIWLGTVAPGFYRSQIGYIMAEEPNWLAAIIFYIIFIVGLVVFVTQPAIERKKHLSESLSRAALFGLVTYATYDLTNLATLEGWPLLVTVVDLCWGVLLCTLTTLGAVLLGRQLKKW